MSGPRTNSASAIACVHSEPPVFNVLYPCVVEGIFSDPIYGGNKDKEGWKLVGFPGVVATHANDIETYRNKPYPVKYLGIADLA